MGGGGGGGELEFTSPKNFEMDFLIILNSLLVANFLPFWRPQKLPEATSEHANFKNFPGAQPLGAMAPQIFFHLH